MYLGVLSFIMGKAIKVAFPIILLLARIPGTPCQLGLLQIRCYFSNSKDTTNYSLIISKVAAAF